MTTSSSSSYITAAVRGEKEETTQYSSLSRNPERLPSSNLPSHAVMGVYEATFSSCPSIAISNLAGGGLLLQHQGPQHAQLLVVYSRGCPTVYGHPEAGHVRMGTPGTPMSMGPQPLMTLHPLTSNLPWSRLRSDLTPPPLLGHLSHLLTAMCYSLDRGGMAALASTYTTGSYRQLQLLIQESTKQLDSLIIVVLVSMGDINASYAMDCTDTHNSYYGLFATLLPAITTMFLDTTTAMTRETVDTGFGLDLGKLPDCFTIGLLASMGEGEIIGTDVRRLDQPRYFIPERSCHVTPAATQPASH